MDEVFETILKITYTHSQFKHIFRILKSYFNQKFFGGEFLTELTEADLSWINSLSPSFFDKFTKYNLSENLQSLEQKLVQTPTLIIYVAFDPTYDALYQLGQYVRGNFTFFKLIDIKYDPSLLAGCALVWMGVYKDYSLKARIEERKEQVLESFKKFLS